MEKKIKIKIEGMHCASCALNISKNLNKKSGIINSDINFAAGFARIKFDNSKIKLEEIEKAIVDTGYKVVKKDEVGVTKKEEKSLKIKVIFSIIFTIPIFVRMFWPWEVRGEFLGVSFTNWIQHSLAFVVVFVFGWRFHFNFFKDLIKKQLGMDALISIGTLSAYFYSLWAMFNQGHIYFESAATITTLILLGRFLELKTKNRASNAMRKLMELGAKKAVVVEKGVEIQRKIEDVNVNDILIVRPSEKIPLDGKVQEGSSYVDEAMISGESLPVLKKKGDNVFGATINKDGVLKILVTKKSGETMLANIIEIVESAQEARPPMQKLADKIASIFVPVVIVISFLTFMGWFFYSGVVSVSLINAVAVLIISCPCALGIATPIAVMVGSSVGAQNGILIKSGEIFEKVKNISCVLFDKTGTLTEGKPEIEKIIINKEAGLKEKNMVSIAASVAKNSHHPLSKSIVNYAKTKKIKTMEVDNFKEIAGLGVEAKEKSKKSYILLGNLKILTKNNLDIAWAEEEIKKKENKKGTMLFLAYNNKILGAFLIADKIRKTSQNAIEELKKMGMQVFMISGDNNSNVGTVATTLGIKKYYANVLPQDKQTKVKELQNMGKKVAFVGDGINDAPALVQSDLGITMAAGTDIAKESGDIIITQNDPYNVVEAIILSKKTFKIIKQNLFWAFFYNIIAIPLAVAGVVNPMIGALAMGLSDVFVIGNSLRIYKK